jgi:molybdate transport system substrate-binding protein
MILPKLPGFVAIVFLSALAILACSAPAHAHNIVVFAAASLKDALDDVDALAKKRGIANVVASYAASSALAKQIENGAPADVFISADLDWMDYLEAHKLVRPGSRTNLMRNELVLIEHAPGDLEAAIARAFPPVSPERVRKGRIAIADPDYVPAGKYAKAALESLGRWSSVSNRLVRAENVRAALLFVARGEVPLGIVYRTDATAEKNVRITSVFPASSHPPIVYPAAVLASSRNVQAAEQYLALLKSPGALALFRKHGFMPY